MIRQQFIKQKAPQLAFYTQAFLHNELSVSELELFLHDTLEEWQQFQFDQHHKSEQEQVFWDVMFTLKQFPSAMIRTHRFLREKLQRQCQYLTLGGEHPDHCIPSVS